MLSLYLFRISAQPEQNERRTSEEQVIVRETQQHPGVVDVPILQGGKKSLCGKVTLSNSHRRTNEAEVSSSGSEEHNSDDDITVRETYFLDPCVGNSKPSPDAATCGRDSEEPFSRSLFDLSLQKLGLEGLTHSPANNTYQAGNTQAVERPP